MFELIIYYFFCMDVTINWKYESEVQYYIY